MSHRILDFGEVAATLKLDQGLLSAIFDDGTRSNFALQDLAAVVTSHRQVMLTQNLLAALGKAGVPLVCCDERHHPASMLLPLEGNFEQAERFYAQAEADLPTKKRVWREIVRAKLRAQGRVLAHLGRDEAGLSALAGRVRSGDAGNLESTGALRYWPRVFGDAKFRRGNDDDPRNALLNYGYAVLRATSARAICGVGLHPTFGVHHQNRYNAFALADDLMEPLRPLVDLRVARFLQFLEGGEVMLNKTSKAAILSALTLRYSAEGESRTLFDLQARVAYSLAAVLTKKEKKFRYPDLELDRANE